MSEFSNIMRAERARTGNYGADRDFDKHPEPCPMCGSIRYEKYFETKNGIICGCDECITGKWVD